ncbi:MAG: Gfo/Idh/MocA family oxidoreductase [Verrucomicrobia bacterium]|nr:Gfo/Idh/MocA family oxidoreductase [Verrucomicrobiota bacterium]MBU1910249.1 Gfo/Idh/MocA family oxidoreductase [Verrucomicrobiota bacterium]
MSKHIAVVGMGYWGKNLARNFLELGALHTICDTSPAVEKDWKSKYPDVRFTQDIGRVLADPDIQAVALATPAVTHYGMARTALEAGKDVFVEKPLAIKVEEGRALVDLSARLKRILMVGHILRFHPAVIALGRLIAGGDLGQIQYLYSNRLNIGKIRTEENILWSFAPHDISVMLALLNEMPMAVACQGGGYLNPLVMDVTTSEFAFPSGVRAHIYVSWLHPFKEQRLVVVGSQKMAVFDDTAKNKLVLYPHKVEWKDRVPTAVKAEAEVVTLEEAEPLKEECRHFLACLDSRAAPVTDGAEGLRVLSVLDACQRSLASGGGTVSPAGTAGPARPYFVHETACVDQPCEIGAGTKIWHFSHVLPRTKIGERCILGQNVHIADGVVIGNNVKIQNNVSVYTGTVIEDDVFLGPSCVLTNVTNPRSQVNRHALYEKTLLKRGCSIGANATIVCGVTVGRYAFIGAGSVVTKDVPDYALVLGTPARSKGWMSRHGHRLGAPDGQGVMRCPESGFRYKEVEPGVLRCLDLDEEAPLPPTLAKGEKSYDEFKKGK